MSVFPASLLAAVLTAAPSASATQKPLLGASLYGALGGFADAPAMLVDLSSAGFRLVSFVPTYPYVGLDRIDFSGGPRWEDLERAVASALASGFTVVLKPHLDPPAYITGYKLPASEDHSWRKDCPWRGYFDVDPMSDDYREGLVSRSLELLRRALDASKSAGPVRLEIGAELMDSMVYHTGRWGELLAYAKRERRRLGLEGAVLLSYNFEHHVEIPGDVVARLSPRGRRDLARFIRGLDALSLSQYMDLTVAVPEAERSSRLPTTDEVARALVFHEERFKREVLGGALGLSPAEVPPLHIGEFGVGRGGLRHPNEWAGDATPEQERRLAEEIALGHAGLARYLSLQEGRTVRSAVLWTVGRRYDVFGWAEPGFAIPAAAAADRAYLTGP